MESLSVTIQMKTTEQYFPVVQIVMVLKGVFWVYGWNPIEQP